MSTLISEDCFFTVADGPTEHIQAQLFVTQNKRYVVFVLQNGYIYYLPAIIVLTGGILYGSLRIELLTMCMFLLLLTLQNHQTAWNGASGCLWRRSGMCTLHVLCVCVRVCSQPYFQELIRFMSSGPSHVLVISNPGGTDDVISAWQAFLGPGDIEEVKRGHPERYTSSYTAS